MKNKEKEIELEKEKICKVLGCKNGSECQVSVVDDEEAEETGIITSLACACKPGYHGKGCSTELEECTQIKIVMVVKELY